MLDNLGIVSISWRHETTGALRRFTLGRGEEPQRLRAFAARASLAEVAYLTTCNRVEVIFAATRQTPSRDIRPLVYELLTGEVAVPGEAARRFRAWEGEGAAEHLCLVVTGLHSACVGEVEIVGQVKACHEDAVRSGLSGPRLQLLFEEVLRIAAEIRSETGLGEGRASLAGVVVEHIRRRAARTPGLVVVIGVSSMTERAARSLRKSGIPLLIVNRTEAKARALATQIGAQAISLEAYLRNPPAVEAVLSATNAQRAILDAGTLERIAASSNSGEAPLLIDMALVPDMDAAACARLGLTRIGLEEITREADRGREERMADAARARVLIDEALVRLHDRFAERVHGPVFGALQRRYRRTVEEGRKQFVGKQLNGLGPEERRAVEEWSEMLAHRFASIPCLGLKGLLRNGPEGSVEAFLGGLEPELRDELRQAIERNPHRGRAS